MTLLNSVKRIIFGFLVMLITSALSLAAEIDTKLVWHQKTVLSTPVSGVVKAINVAPGASVNKGDVLLQLDDRAIIENLAKAMADVERARLLEEEAERELDRTNELYEQTLIADHEKQMAIIAHADAQAKHQSAKAALAKAQMDMDYSAIRAPYDAIVVKQYAQVGQTIANLTAITPLLEVAERGKMAVKVLVSGGTVGKLKIGNPVKVQTAGRTFNGTIEAVSLEPVSEKSNKYEVKVSFSTQGRLLRAGRSAKVSLP
ncbi:MAG: efflux RND transporter periplasmic adaptor subunit [Gammaproteobacteria bacterium]|jgi:membrane fusion protein, multidrug efflux system